MLYRATELIAYPVVRAYFRPVVTGLEHVPRSGAAIVAANHLSAADEVVTPVATRRQVVYFAKAEYFTQPGILGAFRARLFREFGHVPDRSRAARSRQGPRHLSRGHPVPRRAPAQVPHRRGQTCAGLGSAGHP